MHRPLSSLKGTFSRFLVGLEEVGLEVGLDTFSTCSDSYHKGPVGILGPLSYVHPKCGPSTDGRSRAPWRMLCATAVGTLTSFFREGILTLTTP